MAFDGNGTYNLPSTTVTPAVSGTTIDSAEFNTFTADLATALTLCLTEDGNNTATANLPMGGFRHTGVGAALARDEYVAVVNLQAQTYTWEATETGVADAYIITPGVSVLSYVAGQRFSFIPANDNTGASTLAVSALATTDIKLADGTDPAAGDLNTSGVAEVVYDGTNFILINPATLLPTGTQTLTNKTLTSPTINTPDLNDTAISNFGGGTLTLGTEAATTSGTTVDFTSIPSWVKKITILFEGVSYDAGDAVMVQIGDSGGVETASYKSEAVGLIAAGAVVNNSVSTGFVFYPNTAAGNTFDGSMQLYLKDSTNNTWSAFGSGFITGGNHHTFTNGNKSLSATLDRVRITSESASTFDAGSVNIIYEG